MRKIVAPVGFGLALVVAWVAAVASGVPAFVLPSPDAVGRRLLLDLSSAPWWVAAGHTFGVALGGCALGGAAAYALALLTHRFRWAGAALNPYIGALQAVPAIAIAPLLVLWVGYGATAIVVLCALMVFFPILVSTASGLRHVDPRLVDAARLDGASPRAILWRIEAPLAAPATLAGLRAGFTLSITGAIVGEMVMGGEGLGSLLTVRRDAVDTAGMFAVIVVLAVVAAAIFGFIRWWERRSRLIESLH